MILTVHIIVGGLLAGKTSNYLLAVVIGAASHYILDFVPHIEYPVGAYKELSETHNLKIKKAFWFDSAKILLDFILGFIFLIFFSFYSGLPNLRLALVGGLFGMLPDALTFLYWITPENWPTHKLLKAQYDFQFWIQKNTKTGPILGTLTQVFTIAIILAAFSLWQ